MRCVNLDHHEAKEGVWFVSVKIIKDISEYVYCFVFMVLIDYFEYDSFLNIEGVCMSKNKVHYPSCILFL